MNLSSISFHKLNHVRYSRHGRRCGYHGRGSWLLELVSEMAMILSVFRKTRSQALSKKLRTRLDFL